MNDEENVAIIVSGLRWLLFSVELLRELINNQINANVRCEIGQR